MNFYNPYLYSMPSNILPTAGKGLFSKLFGGIKLSGILSGASKTLNFVNQTIPVIKQVSPMVKNAKTMFKVLNEFKKSDNVSSSFVPKTNRIKPITENFNSSNKTNYYSEGPIFFI